MKKQAFHESSGPGTLVAMTLSTACSNAIAPFFSS
jgi:hypothetical protein